MNNFDTLFGQDVDYLAFSSDPNYKPSPVDTPENLTRLAKLQTGWDVTELHVTMGEEMSGKTTEQRSVEGEVLRVKGNALFSAGKYEEALQVYTEAMAVDPHEVRLFTNAAICLMALDRNEEATTLSSIATDIRSVPKAYLLYTKAQCNLGYTEVAREHVLEVMTKLPMTDWGHFAQETEQLIKAVPKERRRKTDAGDKAETLRRLLAGQERSSDVYSYLLQHLLDACTGVDDIIENSIPVLVKCLTQAPWLNWFVKDPSSVSELDPGMYRLLGTFMVALQLPTEERYSVCQQLVDEPCFIPFLANLGKALIRKHAVKAAFTRCGPGYVFGPLYAAFIAMLVTLSKYPRVRNEIFRTTAPFNDVAFYAMTMSLYPTLFDPADSPDTNKYIGTFASIMAEEWFLDKTESDLERFDYVLSLLATISTIHLQSLSEERRLEQAPMSSFFPFWVKASQRPRLAEIMARRPGVWSHLSIRLHYATKDLRLFMSHQHHRDHLEETLGVITRLVQFLPDVLPTTIITKGSRHRLLESFTILLNLEYSAKPKATIDQCITFTLQALSKLARWAPQFFAKDFLAAGSKQLPNLVSVATKTIKSKSPETISTAVECLSLLIKHATSDQIAQLTGNKNVFPDFVAKLVSVLAPSVDDSLENKAANDDDRKKKEDNQKEVVEIISSLLGDVTDKEKAFATENVLMQNLLQLKPKSFLEGVARLVQKSVADEKVTEPSVRSALALMADLVATDKTFEEVANQLNDKLARSIEVALKSTMEGESRSEGEQSNLEHLASILKN